MNPPPMGLPLTRPHKVFCSGQSYPRYGPNEKMLGVPWPAGLTHPLLSAPRNDTYLICTGALIQGVAWGQVLSLAFHTPQICPPQLSNPNPSLVSHLPYPISPSTRAPVGRKQAPSCLSHRNSLKGGNTAPLRLFKITDR